MKLLFGGEHHYYFQAIATMNKKSSDYEKERARIQNDINRYSSKYQKFKDCFSCVDRKKRRKEVEDMINTLS